MPQYKLTYFNIRARAEVSRMLFTLAGVEFEDQRFDFGSKDWPEFKPKTPFGQMPVLEIDGNGVLYAQSNAINRYISKKYGLYGKTDLDQLKIDMVVDSIDDLLRKLLKVFGAETEEEKAAIKKKFAEEEAPPILAKLEAFLKQNKGGDGWLVGDEITWADVHLQHWLEFPSFQMQVHLDLSKYPKVDALKKRVESHPKIADWIKKRPC